MINAINKLIYFINFHLYKAVMQSIIQSVTMCKYSCYILIQYLLDIVQISINVNTLLNTIIMHR